jgi:deoxyribodipyrimidine photolyase-related protein
MKESWLILGNQLFPLHCYQKSISALVFMAEDFELCTHFKYHKHKIMHFLISMRNYRDQLTSNGFSVSYSMLEGPKQAPYAERLCQFIQRQSIERLHVYEIEDKFFEDRIVELCAKLGVELVVYTNPNFVVSRSSFQDYLKRVKRPFMKTFYEQQRQEFSILLDEKNKPLGGQWSFDQENRKKMPKGHTPPLSPPPITRSPHQTSVAQLVDEHFSDHPGHTRNFWLPTSHFEANAWLERFFTERFKHFGDYQDALSVKHDFLYHSLISPSLNIGHLLPREVIDRAEIFGRKNAIGLNSLEGFIRQILGWREFVRGVYQEYDEIQQRENFFNHQRLLAPSWYSGETGIPPLDFAIQKAQRWGYAHHIERLMVISNLMLLTEIHPQRAYAWFMEMFVDSSDWVMGPNVFGMGLYSDGGLFATKPYICASNYLRKMGDFPAGEWCDIVDGLYWRFIEKHRDFMLKQHRLSMMVRMLDKMPLERRAELFKKAEHFLAKHTLMAN